MSRLEFIFQGPPVPASRPRVTRTGHAFNEPKYTAYKRDLATALHSEFGFWGWDIPAPGSKDRSKWLKANRYRLTVNAYTATNRGDIDNFFKSAMDAITQAGLIGDDSQIVQLAGLKKHEPKNPRLEIVLEKI